MISISEIRRTILPEDVFRLIEGYMMGDIKALHIVAVTNANKVIQVSAGSVPEFISANDSNIDDELQKFGK